MEGIVLAGDNGQYRRWLYKNKRRVQDYKYVYNYESIAGYRDTQIYLIGSYFFRKDYEKILEYCKSNNIKVRSGYFIAKSEVK